MSKKSSKNPVNHGMLMDSVNIGGLINLQSSKIVKNETVPLNMKIGKEKQAPKQKVYGGRKRMN